MVQTVRNLIRGASTVLEIWPQPRRFGLKRYQPPATAADAFRMDLEKMNHDFQAVMDRANDEPKQTTARR